MPELFIELLSEEIPARMQAAAEQRLSDAFSTALKDAGLGGDAVKSWSGPRRLAISINNVLAIQPDLVEERRGPRADAPAQAIKGFLKGAGVSRDAVEERSTPKGVFLFAVINKKGGAAEDVIPQLLTDILTNFAWPKSMRWGRTRQRWVRPLHRISVLFDGKGVKGAFDLGGGASIKFGTSTLGHRIVSPAEIELTSGKDYAEQLLKHYVVACRDERIEMITNAMVKLTTAESLTPCENAGLMDEVAGLVEYPHAIMGAIDAEFMDLPPEILTTVMRSHQKYFAVLNRDEKLAPRFITISNMPADTKRDDVIRLGNERVLKARFADAQFFWDQDKAVPLVDNVERLKDIVFFKGLGTVYNKAKRLEGLTFDILNIETANKAGRLAKADLVSKTVGEFPELQGIIGGHLARLGGHGDEIADAIANHYKPEGPNDDVPAARLTIAVALADKLDTLVGFFHVGEVPTGSKDPFALRRAALGVIRIIIENRFEAEVSHEQDIKKFIEHAATRHGFSNPSQASNELMPFIHDRLKVYLRDQGIRHDVANAVIGKENYGGLFLRISRVARALDKLLATEDGKALMVGYKRINNILIAEEKNGTNIDGTVDEELFNSNKFEQDLYECGHPPFEEFNTHIYITDQIVENLNELKNLRAPIDAFFKNVTVNDDNAEIRLNRLNLLANIRNGMNSYADFSKIEG